MVRSFVVSPQVVALNAMGEATGEHDPAVAGGGQSTLYLAGSIVGGAGFGAAFLGGLRALVTAIPPEHRGAVLSAFYVAAYASLSVPAVLAGIVVTYISLGATFEIFGSVVAAIALVVAFEAWRTRPSRPPPFMLRPPRRSPDDH